MAVIEFIGFSSLESLVIRAGRTLVRPGCGAARRDRRFARQRQDNNPPDEQADHGDRFFAF